MSCGRLDTISQNQIVMQGAADAVAASMRDDRPPRARLRGGKYARFPRFPAPSGAAGSDKGNACEERVQLEFRNARVGKSAKIRPKSRLFKPESNPRIAGFGSHYDLVRSRKSDSGRAK